MSISGSLHTALSGLHAVSRAAEVVSSNISNAMTEGYGKREVLLSAEVLAGSGSGVRVDGVHRHADAALIGNRRLSEAQLAQVEVRAEFLSTLEAAIGMPDRPGSLSARLTEFEGALIASASRPDSEARQLAVANAASAVASQLNAASDSIQTERMRADQGIAQSVDSLNATLQRISALNVDIVRFGGAAQDPSALIDQRQRLIDGIAELIPIREVPRDNGTMALYTPGGAILLDGKAAEIGFSPAGLITPDMTLASTALSGLRINGQPVSTSAENGPIAGGKLAGLFALRDEHAPTAQERIDAVARDLVERFADPAVDPTLGASDPGLFTDNGAALVPADELGLAGRISLNALVDPSAGGALWRLRDGLGAAAPGDPGNATQLNALTDALTAARTPASGGFLVPRSAAGLMGDLLSGVSVELQGALTEQSFARAQTDTLIGRELQGSVDTDEEMQKLLLIEQVYAANARVISTIDEMIQTLLRL